MAKVSFIIVNWNGARYLEECLDSIYRQTCRDFEVIVVDNASTDNSLEIIEDLFTDVLVIKLAENMGFATTGFAGAELAQVADAVGQLDWLQRARQNDYERQRKAA